MIVNYTNCSGEAQMKEIEIEILQRMLVLYHIFILDCLKILRGIVMTRFFYFFINTDPIQQTASYFCITFFEEKNTHLT